MSLSSNIEVSDYPLCVSLGHLPFVHLLWQLYLLVVLLEATESLLIPQLPQSPKAVVALEYSVQYCQNSHLPKPTLAASMAREKNELCLPLFSKSGASEYYWQNLNYIQTLVAKSLGNVVVRLSSFVIQGRVKKRSRKRLLPVENSTQLAKWAL